MLIEETAGYDPPPSDTSEPPVTTSDDIELFDMANLTKKRHGHRRHRVYFDRPGQPRPARQMVSGSAGSDRAMSVGYGRG